MSYYNNRIVFKGEATCAYNCHAYAWYCSEGHSYVWINTPGDDAFWNDGSFVQTTNTSGKYCKVSFPNDDHSAVTSSRSGYLISKWGKSPLFEHSINDCPYNSSGLRYYSYPDPTYNTVPPKPSVETFRKIMINHLLLLSLVILVTTSINMNGRVIIRVIGLLLLKTQVNPV